MKNTTCTKGLILGCLTLFSGGSLRADWPQWRGLNRDGKATGFTAPQVWPKQFVRQWKTDIGTGDATPALIGDKLFTFARQGSDEIVSCLDAASGKSLWQTKYPANIQINGPAGEHPGPRSSPAVAEGKVVTLGAGGVVSCLDAASGKVLWRKDSGKDFSLSLPMFYTSSSPLIAGGAAIVHLGGRGKGAIMAFDLNTGATKWKWEGDGPAYASPALITVEGVEQVVEETESGVVGLSLADGKLLWQVALGGGGRGGMGGPGGGGPGGGGPGGGGAPGGARGGPGGAPGGGGPGGRRGGGGMGGGGRSYNAPSPVIDGQNVILTGTSKGTVCLTIQKQGDAFSAKEAWANAQASAPFATPVLKDSLLFGLSGGNLFCLDVKTGKTLWTDDTAHAPRGFGTLVDAGDVVVALTSESQLIVFRPSGKAYSEVARLKAADTPTYTYPVLAGKQIYIKDQTALILYSME